VAKLSYCPQCAYLLKHLEGMTGRISICTRCGWNEVVLVRRNNGPRCWSGAKRSVHADRVRAR
jgi:anaerobic ribonucleoside-triphosphate reductase